MDFTLSLTHFCETHGPKSVLCTQVLPLECARCLPPSPPLRPQSSTDTLSTQVHDSDDQAQSTASLRRQDTNITLTTDFSGASTNVDSDPESPSIERHPLFKDLSTDIPSHYRYGRAQGDTCASCSFTVPQPVASRLPSGAPGSCRADGKNKNGAPVLRSREFVCLGSPTSKDYSDSHGTSPESDASSFESLYDHHHSNCHDHTLTYLTARSPESASTYSTLRNSVVRTLSCELLPRGMSDGPLCFGDSNTGYTIAYVFRLTDPRARGRRRAYAFLALAGTDPSRAFRACPLIWEAFERLAKGIEERATKKVEDEKRQEEQDLKVGKRNYTPTSSFLTQRQVDPDGTARRAGQTTPRSLSEIVGDENIFAILHQYFVALLCCLGDRFGGLPLADKPSIYQTLADEEGFSMKKMPSSVKREMVKDLDRLRENDTTPRPYAQVPTSAPQDAIDVIKKRTSKNLSLQCAPMVQNEAVQQQMVM